MTPREQWLALVRFHWAAGARVALRANAFVLGSVVFLFGSAPDGLASLRAFVLGVVAQQRSAGDRAILAVIAAAFAATAVPRVTLGATGWLRSLPADARATWRASVAALCMAQVAVITFVPLSVLAASVVYHARLSPSKIASLPLLIVAVAMTSLPARPIHTQLIAALAVVLSVVGTWPATLGSLACVVIADATSPALVRARVRSRGRARFTTSASSAFSIWVRASWRAMRPEGIAASAALPIIIASYAYFIVGNNPELARSTAETVVRVCGGLSLALFSATLANELLTKRQTWAWSRSLPWSSTQRVLVDACVLGVPLLVIPFGLLFRNPSQAAVVGALVPLGATAGAAAVRKGLNRPTGAAGESLLVVLVASGAIALWPALALAALLAAPLFVRLGARRERNAVATRWTELHHDAAGDPGWLSGA